MEPHRISLPNTVFEGLNNAYVLDGEETVLIDVGVATEETRERLRAGLADIDLSFSDVDRIFLTHWHQDHLGLAGEIQAASGASIHVHEDDAALAQHEESALNYLDERTDDLLDAWEMPAEKQAELRPVLDGSYLATDMESVETFADGETFDVNDTTLEVVHSPGHTSGQTTFAFEGERGPEAFTGDALLPQYTPNVGGADVTVERPLEKYLDTLRRIEAREFERAWPGHRDPIDDPSARAAYILEHHEERAWRVLSTLADDGPLSTWAVSANLFGELSGIHILHGPGEAHAHLDHLERIGDVERGEDGYLLADGTEERMADHVAEERWPL